MRNSIKKYFTFLLVYLIISAGYLIYYYVRNDAFSMEYLSISIFIITAYTVVHLLIYKFCKRD